MGTLLSSLKGISQFQVILPVINIQIQRNFVWLKSSNGNALENILGLLVTITLNGRVGHKRQQPVSPNAHRQVQCRTISPLVQLETAVRFTLGWHKWG